MNHLDGLIYSRAKLGPRRFFWLVTRWPRPFNSEPEPGTYGYTTSAEEALSRMEAVRQSSFPKLWFVNKRLSTRSGFARAWHMDLVRRRRKLNDAIKDSKLVEYLWQYSSHYQDIEGVWEQVPIVKKTAKRIFIKLWWHQEKCHVIDRQQFEATGHASTGSGWGRETYYHEPQEWGQQNSVPDCLRVFGLTLKSTLEDLRAALRREVKTAHPDHGGTSESFRALRESFEIAERMLRHTVLKSEIVARKGAA